MKNINRTELPNQVYLCSAHFEENCFDSHHEMKQKLLSPNSKPSRKLVKGAVPTIFPHRSTSDIRLSSKERLEKKNQNEVNRIRIIANLVPRASLVIKREALEMRSNHRNFVHRTNLGMTL